MTWSTKDFQYRYVTGADPLARTYLVPPSTIRRYPYAVTLPRVGGARPSTDPRKIWLYDTCTRWITLDIERTEPDSWTHTYWREYRFSKETELLMFKLRWENSE